MGRFTREPWATLPIIQILGKEHLSALTEVTCPSLVQKRQNTACQSPLGLYPLRECEYTYQEKEK